VALSRAAGALVQWAHVTARRPAVLRGGCTRGPRRALAPRPVPPPPIAADARLPRRSVR